MPTSMPDAEMPGIRDADEMQIARLPDTTIR